MTENPTTFSPMPAGLAAATLDALEPCASAAGWYTSSGRATIGQVLRPSLDAMLLTPTELLHSHRALQGMLAQQELADAALQRVAGAQSRGSGSDLPGRLAALRGGLGEVTARAADAARTLDGAASRGPPFAVLQRDRGLRPGESAETDYLLLSAVCRESVGMRGWLKKLAFVVSLSRDDGSGRVAGLVDGAIADLLGVGALLSELFGPQPLLGEILRRTLELVLTDLSEDPAVAATPLGGLNVLLRSGRLPVTRATLLDRCLRQLRAPVLLGSGPREEDIRLFDDILGLLVTPDGVAGDGPMAEALVERYGRRLDSSGGAEVRAAMQGVSESLPNLFSRLHFLAALATSALGGRAVNELVLLADNLSANESLIEHAVFQPFEPVALQGRLERAALAFERTGLPAEIKTRLRERITGLVDSFVMRGSFLDRLDAVEPSVPERIQALQAVLAAGLVSPYGGQPLIEQHITRLTERPGGVTVATRALGTGLLAPAVRSRRPDARLAARFGRTRCPNCFETKSGDGMCLKCGHDESEGSRPGVHLPAGFMLEGRYVVGRLIGQGGFGATYLGWDERLQVKVAIKEYFPVSLAGRTAASGTLTPYTEDLVGPFQDGIVKFLEEARILARMRNVREIVEVHDYFEANGTAYMIMELLVGRTLQRYLLEEGGTIDYRRALGLILPIAKAVHDVHQLGLVHRDISPDNIFLLDDGGAKLLDFGAARHCVGEATGALTVILKRGYAPPEQYSADSRQGPWTDVYALCATFYCAITGRPPPDSPARWASEDSMVRPSALGIVIPPAIEGALLVGLALRWQDRPRDMKALLHTFSRALS